MKFTSAMARISPGYAIQCTDWNGANQFVFEATLTMSLTELRKQGFLGQTKLKPVYILHNAKGELQPGWVPSQGDLRNENWIIVKIKDVLGK